MSQPPLRRRRTDRARLCSVEAIIVEKVRPLLQQLQTRSTSGVDTTLAKLLTPDLSDLGIIMALRGCIHCPRQRERYWEQHYQCVEHDVWTFDVSRQIRAVLMESFVPGCGVSAQAADDVLDVLRAAVKYQDIAAGSQDDEKFLNRFIDLEKLKRPIDDNEDIYSDPLPACQAFIPYKLEAIRMRLVAQNHVLADDVTFAIRNWALLLLPLDVHMKEHEQCGACTACWLCEVA